MSVQEIDHLKLQVWRIGSLYNASLQTMLGRVRQLRRNPLWQELGRGDYDHDLPVKHAHYNQLWDTYGLSQFATVNVAQGHWRASKHLPHHIDSRACDALGGEIWKNIKNYLYRKTGEPDYKPSAARSVIEGNNPEEGLHYQAGDPGRPGRIKQETRAMRKGAPLGKKKLDARTDWSHMPRARREYYLARQDRVRTSKLVLITESDGSQRAEAHIVFDCLAYRSQAYLQTVNTEAMVSMDMGPSSIAWVSYDPSSQRYDSGIYQLHQQDKSTIDSERGYRKQRLKAQARSRRNTNLDCYEPNQGKKQGKHIRGKRIRIRSTRHERDGKNVRKSFEREERIKARNRERITRELMQKGSNIITEADTPKDWQQKGYYGRSIARYAPAALKERILREARRLGGSVVEHNTYATCLSQYCLCGWRVKKPTQGKTRAHVHQCQNQECKLYGYALDRDLFAAFLGLLTYRYSTKKLISGKLANEHWVTATEMCSVGSVVAPSSDGVEPVSGGDEVNLLGSGGEASMASRQPKVAGINGSRPERVGEDPNGSSHWHQVSTRSGEDLRGDAPPGTSCQTIPCVRE